MSIVGFGVNRPVAANLVMLVMIIAGTMAGLRLQREFFPDIAPESATVFVEYPGATAEDIEATIIRKIEDALVGLDAVEQVRSHLEEGWAVLAVEFREGEGTIDRNTQDVERAIDALLDIPTEVRDIRVMTFEPTMPAIMLSVYGECEEGVRKRVIKLIEEDLRSLPGMGTIEYRGVHDDEITVDVRRDAIAEHGISLTAIAQAVREWMTDLPGGIVQTESGNISVRMMGSEERVLDISNIVVNADTEGRMVLLKDIADIREGHTDELFITRFTTRRGSGPDVSLVISKKGDQDAVSMARMARAYVAGRKRRSGNEDAVYVMSLGERASSVLHAMVNRDIEDGIFRSDLRSLSQKAYELGYAAGPLPEGLEIDTSVDLARFIEGRISLMLRNALAGAALVFLTLLLFLNWRAAWWVGVGLVTAVCGTLFFMFALGITLNLLTMFAIIIVLGLVVDDAIVVTENITARSELGDSPRTAAIEGARQVQWPVIATVITTIVAFLPLAYIKGQMGDMLGALPLVVACALMMSLLESLFILPSHLHGSLRKVSSLHETSSSASWWKDLAARRDRFIHGALIPAYGRFLARSIRYRYVSLALVTLALVFSFGMLMGGRVKFEFMDTNDSETIVASLSLPIGAPLHETESMMRIFELRALDIPEMVTISTLIGVQVGFDDMDGITTAGLGTNLGQIFLELQPVEKRTRTSMDITASYRELIGQQDGVESLRFTQLEAGPGGRDITILVSGDDEDELLAAVASVRTLLASRSGVHDISDSNTSGQREARITLKPGASSLGFTAAGIGSEVRASLQGIKAHVFTENREDVEIRVRLDSSTRGSLHAIENQWIVSAAGRAVPLSEIAHIHDEITYRTLNRTDRRRTITVNADTSPSVSTEEVMQSIAPELKNLAGAHIGVQIKTGGRQRRMAKAFASLPSAFGIALLLIYLNLAWLFRSYVQPVAVMLAIPFGLIGVIWGHYVTGYTMTFVSLVGFVALSGIVVNDSLILVQFFNESRRAGNGLHDALVEAGMRRLRPILLTTITTVLGLTPLMLEQSFQARVVIPMAISISFGLISATVLILVVLPCIIVVIDDIRGVLHLAWYGRSRIRDTVSQVTHDQV